MKPFKFQKINKQHFNWLVNKQDAASQKSPHIFPIVHNTCTDKLLLYNS